MEAIVIIGILALLGAALYKVKKDTKNRIQAMTDLREWWQ